MSTDTKLPGPAPSRDDPPTAPVPGAVEFHFTQTDSVAALLRQLGASLLVSNYHIRYAD